MEIQYFPSFVAFPLASAVLFLLAAATVKIITKRNSKKYLNLPPSPWKLPIIGNIHQLLGRLPHRALRDLSQKYSAPHLMHLKLGEIDHVVAFSVEAAKEILQAQDLNFSSRPQVLASMILFRKRTDIAFAPYGNYWRQLRKICVVELLTARRVKEFAFIREEEISNLVQQITAESSTGEPVNLTRKLQVLSSTVTSRTAFGKCVHSERFVSKVLKEALRFLNGLNVSDVFPSLGFVDMISGVGWVLKKVYREANEILDAIIEEHQTNRRQKQDNDDDADNGDLVDVLLGLLEKGVVTMANIKAVILDVFLGGTETTSATVIWAMAELMRHPSAMKKVQSEVREAMRGKSRIEDGDTEQLHYLKLVIKETLRLHPAAPMLLPRICKESCRVLGYDIPAGSRILINAWAIGRDPKYWEDGESFMPERFEGSGVDFRGASFEYLPFGGGRRICPGITYAVANVQLHLAHLLFYFDWQLPYGMKPCDVDMTEIFGAATAKKLDLFLIAKPHRMHDQL